VPFILLLLFDFEEQNMNNIHEKDWAEEDWGWGGHSGMRSCPPEEYDENYNEKNNDKNDESGEKTGSHRADK
jgi:hypothetical protein